MTVTVLVFKEGNAYIARAYPFPRIFNFNYNPVGWSFPAEVIRTSLGFDADATFRFVLVED